MAVGLRNGVPVRVPGKPPLQVSGKSENRRTFRLPVLPRLKWILSALIQPGVMTMTDRPKGDLMERIERLERANRVWRVVSFLSLAGILVVAGYAYSQRDPQKGPAAQPPAVTFPVDPAPAPVTYTNF